MTAASTSNIFASSASTSAKTVKEHTMTISVVSNGLGGLSLEFPTGSASGGLQGESTTYVLEWPATSNTAAVAGTISKSVHSTTRTTLSSTTETTSTTSTTTAQSTTPSSSSTPSAHSSSTQSLLCYDPNANSHSPCPTTTTSPVSSSTSDGGGFNPPGATIVNSQAPKLASFPSLDPLRNFVTSLRAFFQTACGKTILTFVPFACFVFFSLCLLRDHIVAERGRQDRQLQPRPRANIAKPSPRKRPNEPYADPEPQTDTTAIAPSPPPNDEIPQNQPGDTELELLGKTKDITVVKGSARPLLAPRLVRKGEISVVEGSGRPFVRGMRTHSLWEGMGLGKRGEVGAGGDDGGEGEA